MVHRAAGRGQQMSEGPGEMWSLKRKKEVNKDMIYSQCEANSSGNIQIIKIDTNEMIQQVSRQRIKVLLDLRWR